MYLSPIDVSLSCSLPPFTYVLPSTLSLKTNGKKSSREDFLKRSIMTEESRWTVSLHAAGQKHATKCLEGSRS